MYTASLYFLLNTFHLLYLVAATQTPLGVLQASLAPPNLAAYVSEDSIAGTVAGKEPPPEPLLEISGHVLDPESALHHLASALKTLQSRFFALWLGVYPTGIDWTSAVTNTHVSASLRSITSSRNYSFIDISDSSTSTNRLSEGHVFLENEINAYFAQSSAYYYGEDVFGIRLQAHDDMLWVVLGWLESLKFIDLHNSLHHSPAAASPLAAQIPSLPPHVSTTPTAWYGTQHIPAFAHRARIFYALVASHWDDSTCGGGLTWDPRLEVYKNSITNTQFLAASVGMYLYWPGDVIDSPFFATTATGEGDEAYERRDQRFVDNALKTHDWLHAVNLTDEHGLYIDGFHISDHEHNASESKPAQCDIPNPQLYTYNQGVILSGLRGLYLATLNSTHTNTTFLVEGHTLIDAVMTATHSGILGQHGNLAERCDIGMPNPGGNGCSQDAQTFKGLFFLHLSAFCAPLLNEPLFREGGHGGGARRLRKDARWHLRQCRKYTSWVMRNADAALASRDKRGVFGGSWLAGTESASAPSSATTTASTASEGMRRKPSGDDIRNDPSLVDTPRWSGRDHTHNELCQIGPDLLVKAHWPMHRRSHNDDGDEDGDEEHTLETHGSGLAVVRAAYEFLRLQEVEV